MAHSSLFERFEELRRQHGVLVEAFIWICLWLMTSPLMMESIKTLESTVSLSFPYPWMLCGFTNVGTWILCHALRFVPGSIPDGDNGAVIPWTQASALGALQAIEIGISADMLHRISVTVKTEISMLMPALMYIFGVCAGIETLESRLVITVCVVTVGGLLASYGTMTWDGMELVPLAIVAQLIQSIRWVLTQKWLSLLGENAKLSHVDLALRMSPTTALAGFLVAAVREPGAYAALFQLPFPNEVRALLFAISAGACLILVAQIRVVQFSSALLLGFLVPFRNMCVILIDAAMNGASLSKHSILGMILCAVASGCYVAAREEDKERSTLKDAINAPPSYNSAGSKKDVQDPSAIC